MRGAGLVVVIIFAVALGIFSHPAFAESGNSDDSNINAASNAGSGNENGGIESVTESGDENGNETNEIDLSNAEIKKVEVVGGDGGSAGGKTYKFRKTDRFDELQYILVRDGGAYDFAKQDFSISVWVGMDANGEGGTILYRGTVWEGRYYKLAMNYEGAVFFVISDSYHSVGTETTATFKNGNWHHVVAVRDGTGVRIYVDGIEMASEALEPIDLSNNGVLSVGADMGDYQWSGSPRAQFSGEIKRPRMTRRALTPDEIRKIYEKGE